MASVGGLGDAVPSPGRTGFILNKMGAWFGSAHFRGEMRAGGVGGSAAGLAIPEQVEVHEEAAGIIGLGECAGRYVVFKGVNARYGTMTATVSFARLESYPQFSLCAAARGHRGPMLSQMIDFQRGGAAVVRLLGILPYHGELKTATYGGKRLDGVSLNEPIKITISHQPESASCRFQDERAVSYRAGDIPLPKEKGRWGFRSTDLSATIHRVEFRF